jgi:hypothetical protein
MTERPDPPPLGPRAPERSPVEDLEFVASLPRELDRLIAAVERVVGEVRTPVPTHGPER